MTHTSPVAKTDVVQDPIHLALLPSRVLNTTKVRGASVVPTFRYQNDSRAHSSGIQDDCCSDCGPRSRSVCGQSVSDAHSLATKDNYRSSYAPGDGSKCCQACPVASTPGLTAKTEDNVVAFTGTGGAYNEMSSFHVFA